MADPEVHLPDAAEEVRVLRIQPGDVLIATIPEGAEPDTQDASDALVSEVQDLLAKHWPDNEAIVLCGGIELSVGRADGDAP